MLDLAEGRRHARSVTAVAALIALTLAASVVSAAVDHGSHNDYVDELVGGVAAVVTAVVGAVVALARPRNPIGWLIQVGAMLGAVAEALTESGVHGIKTDPGSVPGATYLVTFGVTVRALAPLINNAAVPAFFPDGRLPDGRWRWVKWTLLGAATATILGGILAPIETRLGNNWHGPFTPSGKLGDNFQIFDVMGAVLTVASAVLAIGGLIRRWRRGGSVVRQQLLLFACAVAATAIYLVAVLIIAIVTTNGGPPRYVFSLAGMPLPIAVAIATLNRGLYDLRRATNKTILWLLVTTSIAAIYVAVVGTAAALTPDRSAWWPPALAAGIVAVALLPLRDRLDRVVHRVVYGRWREPYEVLSGLTAQLGAAGDVDRLIEATLYQLSTELDLHDVSVRDPNGAVLAGATERGGEQVALTAYNATVGELCFAPLGRDLSATEQRLVKDAATHLGSTLHARSLLADLQRTRQRLVVAREEERRRLRRDLHDGIGPALAGLTLKAETARSLLPQDSDAAAAQLSALSEEIRSTVLDVRRVVEGLRPPALDELGLDAACRQAVDRLTRGSGVAIETCASPDLSGLPAAVEVAAFHIVLEAVTNVVRHAGATRCTVSITREDHLLVVTVIDDGTGPDESAGSGHGLATMRERAEELGGLLAICAAEPGLQVDARLPIRLVGAAAP